METSKQTAVEQGIHVLTFPGPEPLEKYGRLYIGDDFCERLAPNGPGLRKFLDFVRSNGKKLTLLTAYCTEKGLLNLKPLLETLNSGGAGTEVVVNDMGVLRLLNRTFPNLVPVFGRLNTSLLLHPFFADRRVFASNGKTREFYRERFRLADEYFDVLRENHIKRVEFDSIFALPLFAEDFRKRGVAVSLYAPFTYFTTTRRCLFAGRKEFSTKFALLGCKKECLEHRLILENPDMNQEIFVKGNAQFLRRDPVRDTLAECKKWGADRLVTFTP